MGKGLEGGQSGAPAKAEKGLRGGGLAPGRAHAPSLRATVDALRAQGPFERDLGSRSRRFPGRQPIVDAPSDTWGVLGPSAFALLQGAGGSPGEGLWGAQSLPRTDILFLGKGSR